MGLWELLTNNNGSAVQIQPVIQEMPNQTQLTQELQNRALYSQPQDLSAAQNRYRPFGGLYDKILNRPADSIESLDREAAAYNRQLDASNRSGFGERLKNNLFGRLIPSDAENNNSVSYDDNGNTQLNTGAGFPQRMGGFLNDYRAGFNDNFKNGFLPSNLLNDTGMQKGFGYRMGEALGTMGRFANSPLGRGLITAGLVGLTGGNALQALTFGGAAGALNQKNVLNDRLYRNALENYGIKAPQESGYINNETFKQLYNMKKAQNDAERQAQALQLQRENAEAQRELTRRGQDITRRGQDLNYSAAMQRIDAAERKAQQAQEAKKQADEYGDIQAQLDNFAGTFKTVDNPYRYRVFGWQNKLFNNQSEKEANFNAQRTLLFNQIARRLGGEKGVLSDKDIERIDKALPTLADTLEQKNAKMKAVYALLDIKKGSNADYAHNSGSQNRTPQLVY